MNTKKVLFISRKYPPMKGGMESYSYNLITNYTGDCVVKTLGKKQIHLLWFYPYCLWYILINCKKFDVIELGDMLLCGIGWLAKKINPTLKVIVTVHGLDITYSNPIYRIYLKWFSHGFDCYVPNSSYTQNIAEKQGYTPCTVIFPATLSDNAAALKPCGKKNFYENYNLAENTFIISTVGRLVKRKGVEWFIRNVLPLLDAPQIAYLVIGSGEMEDSIRKTIDELGETRVRMLGRVTDQQLVDIYANSDIFLMPNIYVENDVEGYGMVAVEAASFGCLVIASDMQGISDAVKNGVSGLLYEPESVHELANIINDVINNYADYKSLTITAKEYVKSQCTGRAIAEKYETLIYNI